MTVPDANAATSWAELAAQWQQASQAWAAWWTRGFAAPSQRIEARAPATGGAALDRRAFPGGAALDRPATAGGTVDRRVPAAGGGPFDSHALAALHRSFEPRFAQLFSAATTALATPGARMPRIVDEPSGDRRFASAVWRDQPYFAWVRQTYLLYAEYLAAVAALAQLAPAEKRRLEFSTRQFIDAIAPTNFPATNPDVLERALATDGASLVEGMRKLAEDVGKRRITMSDESAFEVGRNLATTPGNVVFRNPLIELIQYDATTPQVAKRPLVIVPPCINKYYILDLRRENSFVRHAVAQGHTVFMISWRNVPAELGKLSWDDYLGDGVQAALDVSRRITGAPKVNALGFCIGGTLLACALAVLAARGEDTVASATFLTTLLDFADPGEIGVYIGRQSLAALEPALLAGQRVHGSELAGAFASLRPNELVWNYVVNSYLKGRTPPAFDLLHWNGDSANLPGPMYAFYLRNLYLDNRLRERRALTMQGERVDLARIRMPAFILATRDDHIVPWRSAYESVDLLGGPTTFVLGASGHIAGVVNPPEPVKRNHWTNDGGAADADAWLAGASSHAGSWWPRWHRWLRAHGGGRRAAPASSGSSEHPALAPAPGTYVRERVS